MTPTHIPAELPTLDAPGALQSTRGDTRAARLGSGAGGVDAWASREGVPHPQGVTFVPERRALNFALYSKHAQLVTLLLYAPSEPAVPALQVPLEYLRHKSGRIWHCELPLSRLRGIRYYAYRVEGPAPEGPRE